MSMSREIMQVLEDAEIESEAKVELADAQDHVHTWEIDAEGNGVSKDGEHIHEVIGYTALPATEDGHSHRLPLPAETENEEWLGG